MAINSQLQFTAAEIATFCGEPEKIGFYISLVKRIGIHQAYQIMSSMKNDDTIKSRPKIFIYRAKKNGSPG
jgi:hypothetical protein